MPRTISASHDKSKDRTTKRSRQAVAKAACARCRQSKVRCDGIRPVCSSCNRATVSCHYETNVDESRVQARRRQHGELQELRARINDSLEWLMTQSKQNIGLYIHQLIGAENPADRLCELIAVERTTLASSQLSPVKSILGNSPLFQTQFDIEISSRAPFTYPWLDVDYFRHDSSQLLDSKQADYPRVTLSRDNSNMRYWSAVPVSEDLAASLILQFLRVEHPIYGFIDADLFSQDLFARRLDFCSPLLVNAILFWSSCTFSPLYPEASSYTQSFLTASQLLYRAEQASDSPLTVSALMCLTLGCLCFGMDSLAKEFMEAGIRMAEALRLVGPNRARDNDFDLPSDKMSMLRFVAWGAFNLSTVYLLHFHDVHSSTFTSHPPLLSRPGSASFPSFCELWTIAHDIGSIYYAATGPVHEHVPVSFAESTFLRLIHWSDQLPVDCLRSKIMSHATNEMHICYHAIIMDLFRPFLAKNHVMISLTSTQAHPETIFALSFKHLRALCGQYYTAYAGQAEAYTVSWIHGPMYVVSAIISYEVAASQRCSFLQCIEYFTFLVQSHAIVEVFLKGLYGMAVAAGILTVAQADAHFKGLEQQGFKARTVVDVRTTVVLDQHLALQDRVAAGGDRLASRFDEMTLFQYLNDIDII